MPRLLLALLVAAALAPGALAQRPPVVMNLAAHPDDEDGATLAYYRSAHDAAAYSVVVTRGEGGQNEAGPDLYERLGAVRTRETEAAARVLGTRLRFLNFYDFGFSKSHAETFAEWAAPRRGFWERAGQPAPETPARVAAGRDSLVARLVLAFRTARPDVVFTNHDTLTVGPNAQHGHHQATALAAVEAFRLAADPAAFPEQLARPGVQPWQPKRLFVRTGAFGRRPGRVDAAVPVGDGCAATAVRPAEECDARAAAAAGLHVSQGFDKFAERFRRDTTLFTLLLAADGTPPLPRRAADLAAGLAAAGLLDARDALDLRARAEEARLPPLDGLTAEPAAAVPGERVRLAWTPRSSTLTLPPALPGGRPQTLDLAAGRGSAVVPTDAPVTLPLHERMHDRATSTPPVFYTAQDAAGAPVAAGWLPVETSPGIVLDLDPSPRRLGAGVNEVAVRFDVHTPLAETLTVSVTVLDAAGEPVAYAVGDAPASAGAVTVPVRLPAGVPAGRYRVVAEERSGVCGGRWPRVERAAAVLPDVAVAPGLRVGFVRSYDDTTERALRAMGAEVVRLDSAALAAGRFEGLHTVYVDLRAYLDRADLRRHNRALLDWASRGGHVVVAYHKTFEWNPGELADPVLGALDAPAEGFAPYGLVLGRQRVTREDAPVTPLVPAHPVLTRPHALAAADWDGWVQERGLYFPVDAQTDARFERVLAMADPGEEPLTTALLVAPVGAGTYAYSPLGWYRQLEALVPGAWRAVANLVSLPLTDGRALPAGAAVGAARP